MRILDLFAGIGGERRRKKIEARGHELVTLDLEKKFGCTITADILALDSQDLPGFDFVWASPPCEAFSVAAIGHHWRFSGFRKYVPITARALLSQKIVAHTIALIQEINPSRGCLIENPVGMLRKLPVVAALNRQTVTYCRYGADSMKPTDLWGFVPGWKPRPMCSKGNPDHASAPRGSRTGINGDSSAEERAVVPWELWDEVLTAAELATDLSEVSPWVKSLSPQLEIFA